MDPGLPHAAVHESREMGCILRKKPEGCQESRKNQKARGACDNPIASSAPCCGLTSRKMERASRSPAHRGSRENLPGYGVFEKRTRTSRLSKKTEYDGDPLRPPPLSLRQPSPDGGDFRGERCMLLRSTKEHESGTCRFLFSEEFLMPRCGATCDESYCPP